MSIRIMTMVWEIPLSDSDKLVLLALADNANDEGDCWPSIAHIAKKCSKDERTIQRVIARLKSAGHLSVTARVGTSNLWHVHPRHDATPGTMPPRHGVTPPPVTVPPKPSITTNTNKGSRLVEDWEPSALSAKSEAMVAKWQPGTVDRELEKFRNYWIAKSGSSAIKADWQRTWVNWLLSADERIGKHERNRTSPAANDEIRDPMVRAILRRQAERAARPPHDFSTDAGDW